jgi:outer membrane protein assembly factor BamB
VGRLGWSTRGWGSIDGEARFDEGHGQVYVGTDDGTFYALDPALGTVRWSYKGRGAIERRPELSADSVYVTSSADRVVAFEARTGTVRWQYERESPEGFTIHGHAGARLVEGVVYAGFSDGYLVALDGATGDPIWTRSLAGASDQFVDVDTTPTVVENMLVASSYSGGLWALRAKDSEVQWRLGIEGVSAIGIGGGRIYVAAPRDGLAALTRQGHVLWRQGLADAGDLTPPVAVGPYLVFAASRDGLFVIDRESGKLLQIFNPGRGMCAAPAIDSKARRMYALANSGSLYALDVDY